LVRPHYSLRPTPQCLLLVVWVALLGYAVAAFRPLPLLAMLAGFAVGAVVGWLEMLTLAAAEAQLRTALTVEAVRWARRGSAVGYLTSVLHGSFAFVVWILLVLDFDLPSLCTFVAAAGLVFCAIKIRALSLYLRPHASRERHA